MAGLDCRPNAGRYAGGGSPVPLNPAWVLSGSGAQDVFFVDNESAWDPSPLVRQRVHTALAEAHRVLTACGTLLSISFGQVRQAWWKALQTQESVLNGSVACTEVGIARPGHPPHSLRRKVYCSL